ncbi:MAG: hypothetical protein NT123_26420 [Proteobacteria bacterium]|nr:hypothetical protein [Pseudomonadota bacterium]
MKLVIAAVAVLSGLVALAVYDMGEAAKAKAQTQTPFGCRAPVTEGDIAVVTFSLRSGEIVGECHYATARPSKLKKGG